MEETLSLSQTLIQCPSITPEDAGCQEILAKALAELGFEITAYPAGHVHNLWARYGSEEPLFVFAGHTDVVPTGDLSLWKHPAFSATVENGKLYGRGSADMKVSLAAMITATKTFLQQGAFKGSIGFLITSAEEGDDFLLGTPHVLNQLANNHVKIDYCLLGEPSSDKTLGDTLRIGRRGSLSGDLTIVGKQGHVAYPHLADNPIPIAAKIIADLSSVTWDEGNDFFPPTGFQITSLQSGLGARNVIPGDVKLEFNFRFNTESTSLSLKSRVQEIIEHHTHQYTLSWHESGAPFLTRPGTFISACVKAVEDTTLLTPALSTGGGTSDGRFIAPFGAEVVECGPVNATIHQINEHVAVDDIAKLVQIYERILKHIFKSDVLRGG